MSATSLTRDAESAGCVSGLFDRLGLTRELGYAELARVQDAYAIGVGRKYHTWAHALVCLSHLEALTSAHYVETAIAILFHDAVFRVDAPPGDNEVRSAGLMRETGVRRGWPEHAMQEIERLILATARHGRINLDDLGPTDGQMARVLDCDLASLAASWETFVANNDNITAEYLTVYDAAKVAVGREKFLRMLLAKPTIFLSHDFAALEWQARHNIVRLLRERFSAPKEQP